MQVDPIKAKLKQPGTKRLKLKYGKPISRFAFKFNLRQYIMGLCTIDAKRIIGQILIAGGAGQVVKQVVELQETPSVSRCKLKRIETSIETACIQRIKSLCDELVSSFA